MTKWHHSQLHIQTYPVDEWELNRQDCNQNQQKDCWCCCYQPAIMFNDKVKKKKQFTLFFIIKKRIIQCKIIQLRRNSSPSIPCQRDLNDVSSCLLLLAEESISEHGWRLELGFLQPQSFQRYPSSHLSPGSQVQQGMFGAPLLSMELLSMHKKVYV